MTKLDIANEAASKEMWRRAVKMVHTVAGQDTLEVRMENKYVKEVATQ